MTSCVYTVLLHPTWLTTLVFGCCLAIQGHPVTPMARMYRDFETPHGIIEVEISPHVFKEFTKEPVNSWGRRPMSFQNSDSEPIAHTSFEMRFSSSSSSSSSQPVIFEDELKPIILNDSDIDHSDYHHDHPTSDKRNSVKNDSEGSKIKKDTINDATYVQRFLSKVVTSNDCPKGHTYSKFQKRCMKKYSFSDSVIG